MSTSIHHERLTLEMLAHRAINYAAGALMDLAIACASLGISLLASRGPAFQVDDFYFRLALLFAVGGVGSGVSSVWLARLSDRFGRRPMLLVSTAGLAVTALLFSFCNAWWQLFAVIIVRSQFMGVYWPSLEARITDGAEGPRLTRRLVIFGVTFCAGLLIGALLGGYLNDRDLAAPFYISAGVSGFLFVLFAIAFAVDKVPDRHVAEPERAVEVDEDTRAQTRRRWKAFLISAWVGNAVASACGSAIGSIFPRFATQPAEFGGLALDGTRTGFIVSGSSIGMLLMLLALGFARGWHYRLGLLVIAQVVGLAGCLLFATMSTVPVLFIGALLYGLGFGFVYLSSIYYSLAGQQARAGQSGLHEAMLSFGFAGGVLAMGEAATLFGSHRAPYWLCVGLMVATMGVQAALVTRARRRNGNGLRTA